MSAAGVPIGYFWGDDQYGLEEAALGLGRRVAGPGEPPLARWNMGVAPATVAAAAISAIAERVATATMFGGGTLAVVDNPGSLMRARADREAFLAMLDVVAPGNALAFLEVTAERRPERRAAAVQELEAAVRDRGGEVRQLVAPAEGQMVRWIADRAAERGIRIEPPAAELLARKIGAFVREGDVDRSRQGRLAVAELDKLAVYRLDGPIRREDVEALVADAVPGSLWALADAVGARRTREAVALVERVLAARPEPVVLTVLHRRVRELLLVADAQERGESVQVVARAMRLEEFPARKLWEQAASWTPGELEVALAGLLAVDAALKGEAGSDLRRRRLAFDLWLADHVARRLG